LARISDSLESIQPTVCLYIVTGFLVEHWLINLYSYGTGDFCPAVNGFHFVQLKIKTACWIIVNKLCKLPLLIFVNAWVGDNQATYSCQFLFVVNKIAYVIWPWLVEGYQSNRTQTYKTHKNKNTKKHRNINGRIVAPLYDE